jgi:hypothetical protein
MDEDYAYDYLIERLSKPVPDHYDGYSSYGYDIYLPQVIAYYAREREGLSGNQNPQKSIEKHWPAFADAAWRLCTQGILRPGVNRYREQSTDEGAAGSGFTVTSFGRRWAKDRTVE